MKTVKNLIIILSVMFLSANICWGQDVQVDRTDSIWGMSMHPSENQEYAIISFYTSADLEVYNYICMEVNGTKYTRFFRTELSEFQVTEQKLLYSSFVTFKLNASENIPIESIYAISFYLFHETPREAQPIETNEIVYNREETSLNMIHSDEGQYERRYFSLKGDEYSNLDFKDNIYITAIYNENKLVKTFKSYKK